MTGSVFWQIVKKDLSLLRKIYIGKFFDLSFLFFTGLIVFGYFMPYLGVSTSYGPFILIGGIASFGLFDIVGQAGELIFDIEGDRTITFNLAMPLPSWAVFMQLIVKWALNCFLICIPLFFVGKLIMWNRFSLLGINYWKLALIFPSVCLFYGSFSVWLTSVLKNMRDIGRIYFRVVNPIFMFGAYFFSWVTVYDISPWLGYALLIDPLVYAMEGMRAACLGQEGYLPFFYCLGALWAFTLFFMWMGIGRLKKRLDCI